MKNSTHFVNQICELSLEDDDMLVGFDEVILFAKVPIDEALDETSQCLTANKDLVEHSLIPVKDLCSLVKLCLKYTYLQLDDHFLEQIEGEPMGSLFFPIVANIIWNASRTMPTVCSTPTQALVLKCR